MSVEFRQRTPAEYGRIVWRRKWLILLPTIAIFFAIAIVVWRLPDVYQSSTLLVVKPSSVPEVIAPQLSDEDLTLRINNISQEVVSRSSLEPLIISHNLYAAERRRGEPMDALVERMRKKDVQIEINRSRNDITNAFNLSFRGPDPRTAQAVAAELASKFTSKQIEEATRTSDATARLIGTQVDQAKTELDAIDRQRLQYMSTHATSLPDEQAALVGRLTGLYEQQKSYVTELGRLRDQRTLMTSQIGDIKAQLEREVIDASEVITDPKTTPVWADLARRESELDAQLQDLLTKLKPKNPDVVAVQQQLAAVRHSKDELLADWKNKIAEKEKRLRQRAENDTRVKSLEYNLKFAEAELVRQQRALDQTNAQIADLEQRVNSVPGTMVGLQALERDFQTKKANYDQLVEKQQRASLSNAVNANAQGESLQVIDPASLPEKPIAPKRPLLLALGLALGLGVGLVFAAALEVPRLLTVQTVEDARHYTSLPVLVSVPELLTAREQRRLKLRRGALAVAGAAATVVAIPALALVLKLTHVFELFTS